MASGVKDVAIIGASLAGSAVALTIARAGIETVLIDKELFPRRKACGEGLCSVGWQALEALGLGGELETLSSQPFTGYTVWTDRSSICISFAAQNAESGRGIQRRFLDELLANAASKLPTVAPRFGRTVRSVEWTGSHYRICVDDEVLLARYLVLADGMNSVIAQRIGFARRAAGGSRKAEGRYAFSAVFEGRFHCPLTPHVHVMMFGDDEVVCTPVSQNRLNISVLGNANSVRTLVRSKRFEQIREQVSERIHFTGELCEEPLAVGQVGSNRRPATFGHALAVGDCCECLDPIGGMGMTHALSSGRLAADVLIRTLQGRMPARDVFHEYAIAREKMVRPLRGFTRLTYSTMKSSRDGALLGALHRFGLPEWVSRAMNAQQKLGSAPPIARLLVSLAGIELLPFV